MNLPGTFLPHTLKFFQNIGLDVFQWNPLHYVYIRNLNLSTGLFQALKLIVLMVFKAVD